jgi:phage gpG-like protein
VSIELAATVNIRHVIGALDRIAHLDVKKVFEDCRGVGRFDQRHHWPGLAASTLERRSRPRGRDKNGRNRSWPTKLLGRFPTALASVASRNELVIKSRIARFSKIHQEGGTAGHGARIPRRQYLWWSPWVLGQVKKVFEKAMAKAFDKAGI